MVEASWKAVLEQKLDKQHLNMAQSFAAPRRMSVIDFFSAASKALLGDKPDR